MIAKINAICEEIGSVFRTDDGLTLSAFISAKDGEIRFITRTFDSPQECYNFVLRAKARKEAEQKEGRK